MRFYHSFSGWYVVVDCGDNRHCPIHAGGDARIRQSLTEEEISIVARRGH